MTDRTKLRELNYLIYKYSVQYDHYFLLSKDYLEKEYDYLIKKGNTFKITIYHVYSKKDNTHIEKERKVYDIPDYNNRLNAVKTVLEIYKIAESINLTVDDVNKIQDECYKIRKEIIDELNNNKSLGERRDNRKSKVINGGDNRYEHKNARYPSKKRSKKQWTNFYNLFPKLAERDGWDGEKSKRFNNK